jgi:hypothetical protein
VEGFSTPFPFTIALFLSQFVPPSQGKMVRFFCAVARGGGVFSVRVEEPHWNEKYSVDDLKKAIKEKMYGFPADHPDNIVRFCFLQLTMSATHKCNEAILWQLVQPFVKKQLQVCYMALVPDEDKRLKLRLSPEQITRQEVLDHVPLYA